MNCRQARNLFSARLDGELAPGDVQEFQRHLDSCLDGCAERWRAFRATVDLVHDLPASEPDPTFVGRVLDQVRAYEAGRLVLRPARRRLSPRTWEIGAWVSEVWRGISLPVPLRLAAATAFGVTVGIALASNLNWGFAPGTAPGTRTGVVAMAPTSSSSQSTSASDRLNRPFGDLIGELADREAVPAPGDSMADDPVSRAVWPRDTAGSPLRVVEDHGRPQITF